MQKTHQTVAPTGHRRVNVSLSVETLALLDRMSKKGNRSAVLDRAARSYLKIMSKKRLNEELKRGAIANAERDRKLSEEWFNLADDAWPE